MTSQRLTTAILLTASLLCSSALAQAPAKTFDVASIRPSKIHGQEQFGPTPDGWHAMNMALLVSILTAYAPTTGADYYTNDLILGAPDWVRMDRYNIEARVSDVDVPAWGKPDRQKVLLQTMLQALLADRCKLAVHRDIKEVSVFNLTVGKSGPKFKETDSAATHPSGITLPGGGTLVPTDNGKTLTMYGATMKSLAQVMSNFAGRPVIDKTGLTGKYDFSIQKPDPIDSASANSLQTGSEPPTYDFSQLGLHLDRSKNLVESLTIDHIERPTEN